jgi:hypothetical protein
MKFTGIGWAFVLIFVWVATALGACNQRQGELTNTGLTESCEAKVSRRTLDESCVIELSKREIATRLGSTYTKYSVRFDPVEKLWIVMAYNEDGPPDSHTFLSISTDGQLKDFREAG